MQYKGFEFYATLIPERYVAELVAEGRAPIGARKVFACEIYRAADGESMKNVLRVFDLVVGKDIADGTDKTLAAALMGYIDDHYEELMVEAIQSEKAEDDRISNKIVVHLSFDKKTLLGEAGQECLEDAITQELGWLRDSGMFVDGWEFVEEKEHIKTEPEAVLDAKAEAFRIYEELAKLQARPEYQIAAVMAYLEEHCEPEEPLADDERYVLAEKYVEVSGSWFQTTASQQEYLIALGDLLECGITTHNNPDFSELGPLETRKLLLEADEQVFGTLVEAATVNNCYRYLPDDYNLGKSDLNVVESAIEGILVGDVGELIDEAGKKADKASFSKDIDFEKTID